MTVQTQPEALRLADCLDLYVTGDEFQWDIENSAAELRRLHAENESQAARIAQLEAALAGAEPVSGQCRFAGEKSWGWCAVEHVRMVQADPRYAAEGYEVRYLYAHPPASRQPQSDEQIDDLLGEANRGYDIEREHYFKAFRDAEAAHNITGEPA